MTLTKILNDNETDDVYHTHLSMVYPKRKYIIEREIISSFWESYNNEIVSNNQIRGLAEISKHQPNVPVIFDIDLKTRDNEFEHDKIYTFEIVQRLTDIIQNVLREIIINCTDANLICVYLNRPPYHITSNNISYLKNGFHLHFPGCFLNKSIQEVQLIPRVKSMVVSYGVFDTLEVENRNNIIDNLCCKVPWLLYGSSKDINIEPYKLCRIISSSGSILSLTEAFENYEIYDSNSRLININHNIEYYLPQILSKIPMGRTICEHHVFVPKIVEHVEHVEHVERVPITSQDTDEVISLLSKIPRKYIDGTRNNWISMICCLCHFGVPSDLIHDVSSSTTVHIYNQKETQSIIDSYDDDRNRWTLKSFKNACGIKTNIQKSETDLELTNFSHMSAAEYLRDNTDDLFYTKSHKWCIYDNNLCTWSHSNNDDMMIYDVSKKLTTTLTRMLHDTTNSNLDNAIKEQRVKKICKLIPSVGDSTFSSKVIKQLKIILLKPNTIIDTFDNNPNLLSFSNGLLIDIHTGLFRDIVKEDKIMTTTGYDLPNRIEDDIELIKNLIKSITGEGELNKSLLSLCAQLFYGVNKQEHLYIMTGSGGNGKGIIDELLSTTLGRPFYSKMCSTQLTSNKKDQGSHNSELAQAKHSRCIMTSEPEDRETIKTSALKKLTGDGYITARELNCPAFVYKPKFTVVLSCNDIPKLAQLDGGVQRRIKIISFPFEFKTEITEDNHKPIDILLKTKIQNDTSYRNGFLYLMMDTWKLNNGLFYESQQVINTTHTYMIQQSDIYEWFNMFYEVDDKAKTLFKDIYQTYKQQPFNTMTDREFSKSLKQLCNSCLFNHKQLHFNCKRKSLNPNDGSDIF